jgi:hypothetical protein
MTTHVHALAQPIVALLAWTMIMWVWMYATRLPAMRRAGLDVRNLKGTTGGDLDRTLPAEVQWKAHNYNHLLEQPVLFYVAVLLLILLGCDSAWSVRLAWAYVALRVAHSLVQATINRVPLRFALFAISSLALFGLIGLAASMAL